MTRVTHSAQLANDHGRASTQALHETKLTNANECSRPAEVVFTAGRHTARTETGGKMQNLAATGSVTKHESAAIRHRGRTVGITLGAAGMLAATLSAGATGATASTSAGCGEYLAPGCMDYSDGTIYARINASPSLWVRKGPGTDYPTVRKLKKGASVWISCWLSGERIVAGKGRAASDTWDYIISPVRGWVADPFVNTGGVSPVMLLDSCY